MKQNFTKHPESPVSDGARVFFLSFFRWDLYYIREESAQQRRGDTASALSVRLAGKEV